MQNTHLRSLLSGARHHMQHLGRIPYDHVVKMMQAGLDAHQIEENLRKEMNL